MPRQRARHRAHVPRREDRVRARLRRRAAAGGPLQRGGAGPLRRGRRRSRCASSRTRVDGACRRVRETRPVSAHALRRRRRVVAFGALSLLAAVAARTVGCAAARGARRARRLRGAGHRARLGVLRGATKRRRRVIVRVDADPATRYGALSVIGVDPFTKDARAAGCRSRRSAGQLRRRGRARARSPTFRAPSCASIGNPRRRGRGAGPARLLPGRSRHHARVRRRGGTRRLSRRAVATRAVRRERSDASDTATSSPECSTTRC